MSQLAAEIIMKCSANNDNSLGPFDWILYKQNPTTRNCIWTECKWQQIAHNNAQNMLNWLKHRALFTYYHASTQKSGRKLTKRNLITLR